MNGANSDGAIEQRPEVTAPAWHRVLTPVGASSS
jgi:hypothetical protein